MNDGVASRARRGRRRSTSACAAILDTLVDRVELEADDTVATG